jgi:oxygen-dependent protoporphyrinogen oxidase
MSSPAPVVAVVGGGITGLTTAWRLQQQGIPFTLFESGDRCGGVIGTVKKDGYLVERGPNTLLETNPIISEMIDELGLRERCSASDPAAEKRFIVRDGKPVNMPSGPLGMMTTKLFSLPAKLGVLTEPFRRRAPADLDESLADFVRRRLGREFLDYAINPFVAGIYAGDPERLSVREAFPRLRAIEQQYGSLIIGQIRGAKARKKSGEMSRQNANKLSFDDGLQVLTDALSSSLGESIRLGTSVEEICLQNDRRWLLKTSSGEQTFDSILLALPAHRTAAITIGNRGEMFTELKALDEILHPPVASVALGFRRDQVAHPLDGFGALIPEIEGFQILGSIFSSSLFANRAPKDHVLLTSYVGGTRAPELVLDKSHDELCATTLEDLRKLYGISGEPTFSFSTNYRRAIPQYNVGFGKYRQRMTQAEASLPGLFLAGHSRDGISVGDSIESGHRGAGKIDNFLLKNT